MLSEPAQRWKKRYFKNDSKFSFVKKNPNAKNEKKKALSLQGKKAVLLNRFHSNP